MIAGCYYTFTKYFEIKDTAGSQTVEFTTNLDYWYNLQYTWLGLGTFSHHILFLYWFFSLAASQDRIDLSGHYNVRRAVCMDYVCKIFGQQHLIWN